MTDGSTGLLIGMADARAARPDAAGGPGRRSRRSPPPGTRTGCEGVRPRFMAGLCATDRRSGRRFERLLAAGAIPSASSRWCRWVALGTCLRRPPPAACCAARRSCSRALRRGAGRRGPLEADVRAAIRGEAGGPPCTTRRSRPVAGCGRLRATGAPLRGSASARSATHSPTDRGDRRAWRDSSFEGRACSTRSARYLAAVSTRAAERLPPGARCSDRGAVRSPSARRPDLRQLERPRGLCRGGLA